MIHEKLNTLLLMLCRGISVRKLYFSQHPKVIEMAGEFTDILRNFCQETGRDKVFVGVVKGELVFEGKVLVGPSVIGKQLVELAGNFHCGGFSFSRFLTAAEYINLLNITAELTEPVAGLEQARALLKSRGIKNIEIASHYLQRADGNEAWEGQDHGGGDMIQTPTLVFQALFDVVTKAHINVAAGGDIDMDKTQGAGEHLLQWAGTRFFDVMRHIHYPDYDSYTVGHSVRVASLAVFAAWSFGWKKELILALGNACLLHDVGKGTLPVEILFKRGRLTPEEMAVVKTHPRIGAELLLAQRKVSALDLAAAWGHHIRQDGRGYPKPPPWVVRHPIVALIQICDVFEALTAVRPYKDELSTHLAFSIMLKDKGAFQPALLASFVKVIGIYPPGNQVTLSDGCRGLVTAAGTLIDRPEVEITHDRFGRELTSDESYKIHLCEERYSSLFVVEAKA